MLWGRCDLAQADEFVLLNRNDVSYHARVELVRQAEHELRLACYAVDSGEVPRAILDLLCERAREGVNVRIIVDGLKSRLAGDLQAKLAAAGVEVRAFHPLFKGRPVWLNRRLHCKLLIGDRSTMIIGSRNLTDRHFGVEQPSFVDCDAWIAGETCHDAVAYFDWIWDSSHVYPLSECPTLHNDAIAVQAENGTCLQPIDHDFALGSQVVAWQTVTPPPSDARSPAFARLHCPSCSHEASWQTAAQVHPQELQLLHDRDLSKSCGYMANRVIAMIDAAQKSILIESPYPAFSREFRQALERAAERRVEITLLTNSLNSTDQVLVYGAFQNQQARLLRHGVELFEFEGPHHLHAKCLVIDGCLAMLGSYNFDPRSERLNLELCIVTSNVHAVAMIRQASLERLRGAHRVQRPHQVADPADRPTVSRRLHMRSAQLVAPFIRPAL